MLRLALPLFSEMKGAKPKCFREGEHGEQDSIRTQDSAALHLHLCGALMGSDYIAAAAQ